MRADADTVPLAASTPVLRVLTAAALYFALVFGAGFVFGALRVSLVVPRIGVRWAELAEMPLMLVVVVLAARRVVRRSALPPAAGAWLAVGALALALLVAAELGLSAALTGRTPAQTVTGRDPVSGAVYLGMLFVYAAMPAIVARGHRRRASAARDAPG